MSFNTYPIGFHIKLWRYLTFKDFDRAKTLIESLIESGTARKMLVSKEPYEVYKAYFNVAPTRKPIAYEYYFVYYGGELIDYCTSKMEINNGYLKNKGYLEVF